MNCEHVEESLSAYLDNMLAPDERQAIAIHLQTCPHCMSLLTELRQNDVLLARLPRVDPDAALRERLFTSPEMLELAVTARAFFSADQHHSLLQKQNSRETVKSPQLVSVPDGRHSSFERPPLMPEMVPTPTTEARNAYPRQRHIARSNKRLITPLRLAVAAIIIVGLTTVGLLSLSLYHPTSTATNPNGAITPPAGPGSSQGEPLAAGTRFIFLREGSLWSTLADGNAHQPERLTPQGVTVASHWIVSPAMEGHSAGNMLAYIDLQRATVHIIRSDGQQDIAIPQPLLQKNAIAPAIWQTSRGADILSGLAWSIDGTMLAFVGDPAGSGQTNLYVYTLATNKTEAVSLTTKGSITRPIWSPDSARLAFTVTNAGVTSILDYNVQTQDAVELTNLPASRGSSTNTILTLNWSPTVSDPAVTWSLGVIGEVNALWIHHVGTDGTFYPELLASGNYVQALYSAHGDNGSGSWLLVLAENGQAGDIWSVDLTPGANLIQLSAGKQVSLASWSNDGTFVFYLDTQTNGISNGHIINMLTGADQFFASNVSASPTPVWSPNTSTLAYSAGNQLNIINAQNNSQVQQLHLHGTVTSFSWSPGKSQQLVVSLSDTNAGIYLVDTTHNISIRLDHLDANGPIEWTEIP